MLPSLGHSHFPRKAIWRRRGWDACKPHYRCREGSSGCAGLGCRCGASAGTAGTARADGRWPLARAGWNPPAFYWEQQEKGFPGLFPLERNNSSKLKHFWRELAGVVLCPHGRRTRSDKPARAGKWKWRFTLRSLRLEVRCVESKWLFHFEHLYCRILRNSNLMFPLTLSLNTFLQNRFWAKANLTSLGLEI